MIDVLQRLGNVFFGAGQRGESVLLFVAIGKTGTVDDRLGELPQGRPNRKRPGAVVGRDQVLVGKPFERPAAPSRDRRQLADRLLAWIDQPELRAGRVGCAVR